MSLVQQIAARYRPNALEVTGAGRTGWGAAPCEQGSHSHGAARLARRFFFGLFPFFYLEEGAHASPFYLALLLRFHTASACIAIIQKGEVTHETRSARKGQFTSSSGGRECMGGPTRTVAPSLSAAVCQPVLESRVRGCWPHKNGTPFYSRREESNRRARSAGVTGRGV